MISQDAVILQDAPTADVYPFCVVYYSLSNATTSPEPSGKRGRLYTEPVPGTCWTEWLNPATVLTVMSGNCFFGAASGRIR